MYAIYIDPAHVGSGIGRRCWRKRCSSAHRCTHACFLWVLEENVRARRFYERAGFRADGAEEPFDVDGVAVPEVRYVKDLTS